MKSVSKHIILILVLLSTQLLVSQEFKAKVSKSTLGINERFRITFTINAQGADDFTAPDFKNFKLVAGLRQGSNFSNINGKVSFEQSYSLTLQPIAKGVFTIPSATITHKGKTLASNPIKITVQDAVVLPKNPNDPLPVAKENIFLVAEISNINPYLGESISVIYKLYFNPKNSAISNEVQSQPPSFNGFWSQNINIKNLKKQSGKFKGKDFAYYTIRKDILIPQRAGKLTLKPIEVDVSGIVALSRKDFFGQRLQRNVRFTLSAGNRTINVKALPEENKPSNFNGAVGNFKFNVSSTKNTLKANESAQVKVKVSGNGNLKLLSLPKIETPNGLEQYEPEHKESIRTNLRGLNGNVTENYTIVPIYKGKYKIPSLSFSYFNPKEKKYHTINSEALILNVPKGKTPQEDTNTTQDINLKNNVVSENDIRFIHTKTKLVSTTKKSDFFKSNPFWLLLILPLFAIPLGIFLGKKNRERKGDVVGNKRRIADRLAKKYLSNAKKELGNREPFYIALEKALHNYLKAKLQVETSEISKEKISELLHNKKVNQNAITQFLKVLSDCDFARYTPTSNLQMEKEFENAKNIIATIDKQLS